MARLPPTTGLVWAGGGEERGRQRRKKAMREGGEKGSGGEDIPRNEAATQRDKVGCFCTVGGGSPINLDFFFARLYQIQSGPL